MKKLLLRTMLLLCALVVGSTSVWAESATLSNSEIVAAGAAVTYSRGSDDWDDED